MLDIIDRIKLSPLLKNTFKLSTSNVVAIASLLLLTPIISRIYTPELYGEWGVFSNVLLIFDCVLFLSYENALIQTKDEKEVPNLIWLCLASVAVVTLLVNLVFIIGKIIGLDFFVTFPGLEFLALSFILTATYNLFTVMSNRTSLYSVIAFVTVLYGLAQPLLRIIFGLTFLNHNSLIIAYILALLSAVFCYYIGTKRHFSLIKSSRPNISSIICLAKKYKKYPLYDAPSAIVEALCTSLVLIILSLYFKKEEIGCYTMVMQLIILPTTVVGGALAKVFFRELSAVYGDNEKMRRLVIKSGKISFFLSCMPIIFFVCGGNLLVSIFLGEKWTYASQMVLCLSLYSLPIILTEPLMPIFKTLSKQELRFSFDIINLLVTLSCLYAGITLFENILHVLILYSIGNAIMRFLLLTMQLKATNVKISEISKRFIVIVLSIYTVLSIKLYLVVS